MATQDAPQIGSIITSPTLRKWIYGVYVIAVVVAGAIQAALGGFDVPQPDWLTASLAVLGYLGVPIGTLALANAKPSTRRRPKAEAEGQAETGPAKDD